MKPQEESEISQLPELFFGLVAPVGVNLELVTDVLSDCLKGLDYNPILFRVTDLLQDINKNKIDKSEEKKSILENYKRKIILANNFCKDHGNDALIKLTISAIRSYRSQKRNEKSTKQNFDVNEIPDSDEHDEESPLPSTAYIIRQIKRVEEIELLRNLYGRQFILISAYTPVHDRRKRLTDLERKSLGGIGSAADAENNAIQIIQQDEKESGDKFGQNVRNCFPLGDVFIDATNKIKCEKHLKRFIDLLFGNNQITPTHDEYGLYIAKSASLRSSDLSRQVGAAIFRDTGEVVSLGCNEVPKPGGGTYWSDDESDYRDFVLGHDPNEIKKKELLIDIIDRLKKENHFSSTEFEEISSQEISSQLLEDKNSSVIDSKLMDIIEFGRIIHAEMSAISDSARNGVSTRNTTLYCTTFPCHICAKHIVAAGIKRVVYLEPYPKSYATELHEDSIVVDGKSQYNEKVSFDAFIGISPYRYRDLFEKGKRKHSSGNAIKWIDEKPRPIIGRFPSRYGKLEAKIVLQLKL